MSISTAKTGTKLACSKPSVMPPALATGQSLCARPPRLPLDCQLTRLSFCGEWSDGRETGSPLQRDTLGAWLALEILATGIRSRDGCRVLSEGPRRQLSDLVAKYPRLMDQNRAFGAWVLINYVGADEADAVEAVVDRGDDKGIDAIHVPEDGERLSLVQALLTNKTGNDFPGTKVEKTLAGVDRILNGDLNDVQNAEFVGRAESFRETYITTARRSCLRR